MNKLAYTAVLFLGILLLGTGAIVLKQGMIIRDRILLNIEAAQEIRTLEDDLKVATEQYGKILANHTTILITCVNGGFFQIKNDIFFCANKKTIEKLQQRSLRPGEMRTEMYHENFIRGQISKVP